MPGEHYAAVERVIAKLEGEALYHAIEVLQELESEIVQEFASYETVQNAPALAHVSGMLFIVNQLLETAKGVREKS